MDDMEGAGSSVSAKGLEAGHGYARGISLAAYCCLMYPPGVSGNLYVGKKVVPRDPSEKVWHQERVRRPELMSAFEAAQGQANQYVTLNFCGSSRHLYKLKSINAAYLDLDYYNMPRWRDCPPETVLRAALERLSASSAPLPSLVLFSGRGLLLIWLHSILPGSAFGRWKQVQKQLFKLMVEFGPDARALDAVHVFRIPGSLNSKSGNLATVIWSAAPADKLCRRDFDELVGHVLHENAQPIAADQMRPYSSTRRVLQAYSGYSNERRASAPTHKHGRRSITDLWRAISQDLQKWRMHRYPGGLLPAGKRDEWVFLYAVSLSWTCPPEAIRPLITKVAMSCSDWHPHDIDSCISTVMSQAEQAHRCAARISAGDLKDPRYKYSAQTIVALLGIGQEEMIEADLRVLVNSNMKKSRARERAEHHRRGKGVVARVEYLATMKSAADKNADSIMQLVEALSSARQVATILGTTVATARKRISRARHRVPGRDVVHHG